MLHTRYIVGGLLVAATTIGGVVAVDALDSINRAATVAVPARRAAPPRLPPVSAEARGVYPMLALINAERGRRGLSPFAWHDKVAAAAQAHSSEMAARRVMTHNGSDGSDAGDRLRRAGFNWTSWGENVAAGYQDVETVLAAWMASPDHRRQLLGNFSYVGIAAVASSDGTPYWTLDFASGG